MINQMGYEGTPALWHMIIYPLAKTGMPYYSMAITHFLIALAAAIVFVFKSPFSGLKKTFFVLGYYMIY